MSHTLPLLELSISRQLHFVTIVFLQLSVTVKYGSV